MRWKFNGVYTKEPKVTQSDPEPSDAIVLPFTPTYTASLVAADYASMAAMTSAGWEANNGPTPATTENTTLDTANDRFKHEAGGWVAVSHYARIKRKLPERDGLVCTSWFSMKADVELAADHYTQAEGYHRTFGNTDNYSGLNSSDPDVTLNGVSVGAADEDEWRVSLQMWSDQRWYYVSEKEGGGSDTSSNYRIIFWQSATQGITPGRHVVQMIINPKRDNTGSWKLYIDGALQDSGTNTQTVPTMVAQSEIEVTRINCGIDGAAPQDSKLLTTYTHSFVFQAA